MFNLKFLVVGCGSIGERHIRNLKQMKVVEIVACDTRKDRCLEIKRKYCLNETFQDYREALRQEIHSVLVCTPNAFHVPVALDAVRQGCHVFIEKPLSHNLDGVAELLRTSDENRLVVSVGFNLRYHPNLNKMKKLLEAKAIGKVICARVEVGQYLPDWHPWEEYKKGGSAQNKLGGGIILDATHELDYITWLLGDVQEIFCFADKLSNLEIDTEDTAEILLKFDSGIFANIHMDYIQRSYSRSCKIIGDEGTLIWDFSKNLVKCYRAEVQGWEIYGQEKFDYNDTYLNEMRHFIRCTTGNEKPAVDGKQGKKILEIALAAKKSAKTGKVIKL